MNKQLISALVSSAILAGCSSSNVDDDSSQNTTSDVFDTLSLDASSSTNYTYVNLETGQVLSLTEEQAAASSEWHLGFRRYEIKLNGGASGPGNVEGALGVAQDEFYDSGEPIANVFVNADAELEEEHLVDAIDVSVLTFVEDELQAAITATEATTGTSIDMGWYNYDFTSHAISLNEDNYWLVRSNSGTSFAKFHATSLTYTSGVSLDVTFEFEVQADGTTQFTTPATFNASVPASGGEDCFDFDAGTGVDCSSTDWDLKLEIAGRDWTVWTNGGVSGDGNGGAFGPLASVDAVDYTSGTTSSEGADLSRVYSSDASEGIFSENSWYAYNMEGAHKLWPNYRTYVIDTDTNDENAAVFKLQVTSYYNGAGASGHPSIRYMINE